MILATNNKGKLREIKQILNEYDIKGLSESGIDIDVEEDADTFYGNAYKKAKEIYDIVHMPVVADDSGLCIDILNGFPGVMTHRFLGEDADDEMRNQALIEKLKDYNGKDRSARVVCDLVYYDGVNTVVGEGVLKGSISHEERGKNGFGFDSIFELKDGITLAQLTSEEKNNCSARYLAAVDLKEKLNNLTKTK